MDKNNKSSVKINGYNIEDLKTSYLIRQINLLSVITYGGGGLVGTAAVIGLLFTFKDSASIAMYYAAMPMIMILPIIVNGKKIKAMKDELKSRDNSDRTAKFLTKNLIQTLILCLFALIAIGTSMMSIVSIGLDDDNLSFSAPVTAAIIVAAIVSTFICVIIYNKIKQSEVILMSDEALIKEFRECATYIQTLADGASGLKGLGSGTATNSANKKIDKKREFGEAIAKELVARGYKVDTSVLMRNAVKAKSKSDLARIIKGAVVGGVIAGDIGSIVGVAHEVNKINKEKKK